MSKHNELTIVEAVFGLLAVITVVAVLLLVVPRVWQWHVGNWQAFGRVLRGDDGDMYCASIKKIVKADPIFEDNGKYEDESYRVTYEDGSIGLVDQAAMKSGYYCASERYMSDADAKTRGWVLRP